MAYQPLSKPDYTRDELYDALRQLIRPGDVVFVHANIGFFGRMEGFDDPDSVAYIFAQAIEWAMERRGTAFFPTFTYSFCNGEMYDRDRTPSNMGALSEHVRKRSDSFRSIDPCYSVVGMGPRVYELCGGMMGNSFSYESFFGRFHRAGGKILNFNMDAGSTFIHYAERLNEVDYRFDKTFVGDLSFYGQENPVFKGINHTIYVRKLEDRYTADFVLFDELARHAGIYKTVKLGRGEIGVITADDTVTLVTETLRTNPYFLTKGEGTSSGQ